MESVFYAANVRSALKLGHARGVAMLAAVEGGYAVAEYTPAEIKRAVVGYGRAEKHQVQEMVRLLLGLAEVPTPHDAADALAVAICHVHSQGPTVVAEHLHATRSKPKSWRDMKRRRAAQPDRGASVRVPGSVRPPERAPVIARLSGRLVEKQATRLVVDVQRRRVRGAGAALHLLPPARAGRGGHAAHPHPRARGRARRCSGSRPRSSSSCSSA